MKIECYMSSGCGSEDALRKNIFKELEIESVAADVNFIASMIKMRRHLV